MDHQPSPAPPPGSPSPAPPPGKPLISSPPRRLAKLALAALFLALLLSVLLFVFLFALRRHSKPALPAPSPAPAPGLMDPNNEVAFDFPGYVVLYKSGRVDRLTGTDRVAAGVDDATGVVSRDVVIDHRTPLRARLYLPAEAVNSTGKFPVLVYYHGGAFVVESAFSPTYHRYLNPLAAEAKVVVVSVEYRLAPEHPLPAAYDDAWAALNWVIKNCRSGSSAAAPWLPEYGDVGRLFVAGDSAGGNIAHNVAMRAGAAALPGGANITGLLLLDPYFWGERPVAGETTDADKREEMKATWNFVCAGNYSLDSPCVDPMGQPAAAWRRLACRRVAVTTSGDDMFKERGEAYAAALGRSGWPGEVELYETPDEDHCYFLTAWKMSGDKAKKEMKFVAAFLNSSN